MDDFEMAKKNVKNNRWDQCGPLSIRGGYLKHVFLSHRTQEVFTSRKWLVIIHSSFFLKSQFTVYLFGVLMFKY